MDTARKDLHGRRDDANETEHHKRWLSWSAGQPTAAGPPLSVWGWKLQGPPAVQQMVEAPYRSGFTGPVAGPAAGPAAGAPAVGPADGTAAPGRGDGPWTWSTCVHQNHCWTPGWYWSGAGYEEIRR